jgi:hypothetical protein
MFLRPSVFRVSVPCFFCVLVSPINPMEGSWYSFLSRPPGPSASEKIRLVEKSSDLMRNQCAISRLVA